MSLSPLVLKEQTMNLKMSKTIFVSSYVLMSKRIETNGLTDLTDQYSQLDSYFWMAFIASFLFCSHSVPFTPRYSRPVIKPIGGLSCALFSIRVL